MGIRGDESASVRDGGGAPSPVKKADTHMLRLSKKADYALIAMAHLALKPGSASAREIAENYEIPTELMAKVLQRLARRRFRTHQIEVFALRQVAEIQMGQVPVLVHIARHQLRFFRIAIQKRLPLRGPFELRRR